VEFEIRGQKIPLYVAMSRNLSLGSCANMPSLVLPAGTTSSDLPVDAFMGSDRQLLSLGLSLEKVLGPPFPRSRTRALSISLFLQHAQWNTCRAGFSDGIIFMSVTISPRARNKFPAKTLSRSSESS
jgi:hypothetical protein